MMTFFFFYFINYETTFELRVNYIIAYYTYICKLYTLFIFVNERKRKLVCKRIKKSWFDQTMSGDRLAGEQRLLYKPWLLLLPVLPRRFTLWLQGIRVLLPFLVAFTSLEVCFFFVVLATACDGNKKKGKTLADCCVNSACCCCTCLSFLCLRFLTALRNRKGINVVCWSFEFNTKFQFALLIIAVSRVTHLTYLISTFQLIARQQIKMLKFDFEVFTRENTKGRKWHTAAVGKTRRNDFSEIWKKKQTRNFPRFVQMNEGEPSYIKVRFKLEFGGPEPDSRENEKRNRCILKEKAHKLCF